ncbi:Long-chain-alcohol oxidase [Fusarium sp. LHS14.1]|nr:Long-chain-alcohol oxidase [Fusarium sp. LHS14.1]
MAEVPATMTSPLSVGLPEAPNPDPLPEAQWQTLLAVMDTVLSSCQRNESRDVDATALGDVEYEKTMTHLRQTTSLDLSDTSTFDAFLAEKPSEIPLFRDILKRMLAGFPHDKLATLHSVLSLIDNWTTTLPLTGRLTPFSKLSIEDRTRVLHSWRTSSLASFRVLFKQLSQIAKHIYVRASPLFDEITGYPSAPSGWHPVESYPFEFINFSTSRNPIQLETDVIVVGSGCGAGVVARTIATAGHRVIVVDKGYHFETSSLPLDHSEGFFHLFEQSGMLASEDGSITVTAGSCFGGGGTINWSACLQTQNTVRDEWADERGLTFFKSSEFQTHLDSVCERMGVSDEFIRHNHGNSTLLEGGRKLGFSAKPVPQNTGNCEHHDGHCAMGCGRGEKQGPVNGWFPDAAKCGAKFIQGFKVERVLFKKKRGKQVARGVVGTWIPKNSKDATPRVVTIKAKRVVVSAGSLCSPIILKNSGLRNKHIGRNLHLHPTTFVGGVFEQETRPWEGGILTSVVTSLDNLEGKGHGVKLERVSMIPSMSLPWLNWTSGLDYKLLLSKYPHMEIFIAITRDRDSGQVLADPTRGTPRVAYTPSRYDARSNLTGMIALAKILYVQGAREIHPVLPGLRPFIRAEEESENPVNDSAGITDKRFQSWLKEMEAHGNKTPETPFCSAHQMSSCRMSAKESEGVVNDFGKVWGCEGLYVADASVLPSASGVNPMVTTMAICERIGSGIAKDLAFERQETARI